MLGSAVIGPAAPPPSVRFSSLLLELLLFACGMALVSSTVYLDLRANRHSATTKTIAMKAGRRLRPEPPLNSVIISIYQIEICFSSDTVLSMSQSTLRLSFLCFFFEKQKAQKRKRNAHPSLSVRFMVVKKHQGLRSSEALNVARREGEIERRLDAVETNRVWSKRFREKQKGKRKEERLGTNGNNSLSDEDCKEWVSPPFTAILRSAKSQCTDRDAQALYQ